jgi:SAM-dependent methyltransferase
MPPSTSADFDRVYRLPITPWGDVRIPPEVSALARIGAPRRCLELGCGAGRFSRHLASQGLDAVGVDFSPVAIELARQRVANDGVKPRFLVGDVTDLRDLVGPFDFSFDVGCFHGLNAAGQRAYVSEVHRLLRPGGVHLIWALDAAPCDALLGPDVVGAVFSPAFVLRDSHFSRRRLVASHWYWLERA